MLTDNHKRFLWVLNELTKRLDVEAISLTIVDRNANAYLDLAWDGKTYFPDPAWTDDYLSVSERIVADRTLRSVGALPFYSVPTNEDYERLCGIA